MRWVDAETHPKIEVVSNTDFQLGYCMTGTLERGDRKAGSMEMTHYAMVKRKGYWTTTSAEKW